jgi:energy-coupling factor transport system ATP-binding protein
MDRQAKADLAAELRSRAAAGAAVIVATHDPEFAASFATRAVLMGDGRVIADAPPPQILAGGWYFATETARILGGHAGALTADQGVAALTTVTAAAPAA